MAGGSGYVLSKAALSTFVEGLMSIVNYSHLLNRLELLTLSCRGEKTQEVS